MTFGTILKIQLHLKARRIPDCISGTFWDSLFCPTWNFLSFLPTGIIAYVNLVCNIHSEKNNFLIVLDFCMLSLKIKPYLFTVKSYLFTVITLPFYSFDYMDNF